MTPPSLPFYSASLLLVQMLALFYCAAKLIIIFHFVTMLTQLFHFYSRSSRQAGQRLAATLLR